MLALDGYLVTVARIKELLQNRWVINLWSSSFFLDQKMKKQALKNFSVSYVSSFCVGGVFRCSAAVFCPGEWAADDGWTLNLTFGNNKRMALLQWKQNSFCVILNTPLRREPVMLWKKWKEVYCTSNMEKFFRAKNLLDAKNIAYRTNTIII